MNEFTEVIV